jgi:hypothetical protein
MTKHLHREANSSLASQEIRGILRKLYKFISVLTTARHLSL